LFAVAGQVAAQCLQNRVTGNLTNFLENKTVCATATGDGGTKLGDKWQEWHQSNRTRTLTEYGRGPGHPVDPTRDVGTWSAENGANADVTYNYTGNGSYTWVLYDDGDDDYSFCTGESGTVIATATFKVGQASCGF
jgi:hypothetical protein